MTKSVSITDGKKSTPANELANKKHVDDSLEKGLLHRRNQTKKTYPKVSVQNNVLTLQNIRENK